MIVDFWTDDYAPGMVQVRPVSEKHVRKILRIIEKNGGPTDEDSALISFEDAQGILSEDQFSELEESGAVRVNLDNFTVGNLYGYDVSAEL